MGLVLWSLVALIVGCEGTEVDSALPASILGCDEPRVILDQRDELSGYVRCDDGAINRTEAVDVDVELYTDGMLSCPESKAGQFACSSDDDCTARPNGRCTTFWTGCMDVCDCVYLCGSDDDCGDDEICLSPDASAFSYPECIPATCSVDADCPSGECGVASARDGDHRTAAARCRSDADECHGEDECDNSATGTLCMDNSQEERFACRNYWYYD